MSSEPIPAREVRIKTFLEMWRDGILAFVDSGGDPDVNTDAALSTFIYVDDGSDVPDHIPTFPGENSPNELKRLSDILGKYADNRGWDALVVGDEQ
jgi:hypothetical protein